MILTRTPYRVSLFGGGTDYPEWFEKNEGGGLVLGFAINRYCYVAVKHAPPGMGAHLRVVYSKVEDHALFESIEHPAVRGVLQHRTDRRALEIHHLGDLPAMGGLGASSAFVVGLLHSLNLLQDEVGQAIYVERNPQLWLARQAIYVERNVIKEAVGWQDQILTALGGLRLIQFHQSSTFTAEHLRPSQIRLKELEESLVLVHTGVSRHAHLMAAKVIQAITESEKTRRQLVFLRQLAADAAEVLSSPSTQLSELGLMLHAAWEAKKMTHQEITMPEIDALYARGIHLGAIGGKLLGAGGGGFMLFFVPPKLMAQFQQQIGAPCIRFKLDAEGTVQINTKGRTLT